MSDFKPDSDDSEGYKSPPASVDDKRYAPKIVEHKIPLDEYHTCPCCDGKGYVGVVKDRTIEHRTRTTGLTKWRPK